MSRKGLIIVVVFVIAALIGGYLYLRYSALKAKDFKPDKSKSKSVTDMRPALIAKLQQIVKDGSNGLYVLQIKQVEPSLANSTIDFFDVSLTPDSLALKKLDNLQLAPDDVFNLKFNSLHISGLSIEDILNKKNINLQSIVIDEPVISVVHKERPYNADKRLQNDTLTLYEKLTKHLTSISIGSIDVKKAQIISHVINAEDKITRYKDVSVQLKNILVDSSTQFDANRFLYAKTAALSLSKLSVNMPNSLYKLNISSINVSATDRRLTLSGLEFTPRYSKPVFQQKVNVRTDMYNIKIPKLVLSGVDWWQLANTNKLIARQADLHDASIHDYLDRSLPAKKLEIANYPHQVIMKMKMPMAIHKIQLHNNSVTYEEFNPLSSKTAAVTFENINGQISNVTNIPAQVRKNHRTTVKANALFMKQMPLDISFVFDLAKVKSGSFSADLRVGALDNSTFNKLSEPLGLVNIKTGSINSGKAQLKGDNYVVNSNFELLYDDLYVVPLKKEDGTEKELRKKPLLGALANLLLIKKSNPGKNGEVRKFSYSVNREQHPNFFNQLWKTLLTGMLQTVGAPKKLAK